jgi:O-antigen ligase
LASRRERVASAGLRWLAMLLLAQALSVALSTAFSTDRALSLGGSNWRRFGLITQCAALWFAWIAAQFAAANADRVRWLLRVMAAAGILVALYTVAQYFAWDPFINPQYYHIGEAPLTIVRPPGTLGHADYLADYLVYVVFAGVALVLAGERRWNAVGWTAAMLGSLAIVLSGTRAGMVGLAAGALFLALWLRPKIRARVAIAGLAAVGAIAVLYFSPPGQPLRNRTRWFMEDPLGGARLLLWRDTLGMAVTRWAAGWGPETFSINFPHYQSVALEKAYPDFYQESPHNIFLDAFAAQGIPGLVLSLGFAALGVYWFWRARHERLNIALAAMLVAALVSQQFSSFILPTAVYFYLTVTLLVALGAQSRPVPLDRAGRKGYATLAMLPVTALFTVFAVQLLVADASLAQVDRLIRAGRLGDAALAYQRVERWSPPGMRTELWYSRAISAAALSTKDPNQAIPAWQQGLAAAVQASQTSEERQNAWFSLARFYAYQNDFVHTEQSLRAAISCGPNWFKPHWVLAQVLRTAGRLEEARAEAALAADLNAGKNPEVAQTFNEIRGAVNTSKK